MFKISHIKLLITICLMCFFLNKPCVSGVVENSIEIDFLLRKIDDVILNPGMGFYVNRWTYQGKVNIPDYVGIIYKRFSWRELEPAEGVYRFDKILSFVDEWSRKGIRVGFRVMSTSVNQGTLTPDYVFSSGVPGVIHHPIKKTNNSSKTQGVLQVDPVYWDEVYLKKYAKFVYAMGEALEGGANIEFIDLGGIGVFGEMHLGLHVKGMWTKYELNKYGFSEERYFSAYRDMITAYRMAFPNARLFLNISRYDEITDYAAKRGINLRFDGLISTGNYRTRYLVSRAFNKYCDIKNKQPVVCMYEFASLNHTVAMYALKNVLIEPVSYLHLNLGKSTTWSKNLISAIKSVGSRIGYRLVPHKMSLQSKIKLGDKLTIKQKWSNEGVAPILKDLDLVLAIADPCGKEIYRSIQPHKNPSSSWVPLQQISNDNSLKLPVSLSDGIYSLRFGLIDPGFPEYSYNLGVSGRGKDGLYVLSEFNVSNGVAKFLTVNNIQKVRNDSVECD